MGQEGDSDRLYDRETVTEYAKVSEMKMPSSSKWHPPATGTKDDDDGAASSVISSECLGGHSDQTYRSSSSLLPKAGGLTSIPFVCATRLGY
jgi:hypothetical protein